jgi:hypothetical protein
MEDELVSVTEFASVAGVRKQTVFKVMKRLGISASKRPGTSANRGQVIEAVFARCEAVFALLPKI